MSSANNTVWNLNVGSVNIAVFESAEKGIAFLESFGFHPRYQEGGRPYYYVEFTSKEAERKGLFLIYYTRWQRSGQDEPHILRLFQVRLNEQLVFHHYEEKACGRCREGFM